MIKKKMFYENHAPQARFIMKKMRSRQDLSNKMRRRPEVLMGTSIMQHITYFISCTMVKISVWFIVTDNYDSVTLCMDSETRGVIS